MSQFNFEGKQKTTLLAFMIVGVVCMALTFFTDDAVHSRFWSNFLHNSVYFTGIAFISLFVLAAFITAYAGWYTVMKRVWEAYSLFLGVGLVLMIIVIAGLWGHFHHLYHWADTEAVAHDAILSGKSGFLNKYWYTFGTIIIVGVWYFFARSMRKTSILEDQEGTLGFDYHKKMRKYAAIFLPIAAFSSAALIWQWVMSVDAHWYSTMFAWYATASWFVAAASLTILTLIYMKSKGYYDQVSHEHLHDLGKFVFAFSVFWTYLWFSQYMLIWYGNVGEETVYFHERMNNYPVLFYGNLLINFVLPFLVLMRNSTKRKYGTLVFVCLMLFFGHWWDFFLMIKPGVLHTTHEALAHAAGAHGHEAAHAVTFAWGFTLPGFLELGTFLGFTAMFLYFVLSKLTEAPLVPERDPYIGESVHHHV